MTIDRLTAIEPGWDVYSSDGEKVGNVEESVQNDFIHVTKGTFLHSDLYIPISAVQSVDEGALTLNVAKDAIGDMGWSDLPTELIDTTADYVATADYSQTADYTASTQTVDYQPVETARTTDQDSIRVQRHEEELQAQKQAVEAGEVTIRKDVSAEERTLEVPVTREEVQVSRKTVDRPASGTEQAFSEGETIRVPIVEEQVTVTKEPRVVEEVEIQKVAQQETEQVSDTVRREEIYVDESGATKRMEGR